MIAFYKGSVTFEVKRLSNKTPSIRTRCRLLPELQIHNVLFHFHRYCKKKKKKKMRRKNARANRRAVYNTWD